MLVKEIGPSKIVTQLRKLHIEFHVISLFLTLSLQSFLSILVFFGGGGVKLKGTKLVYL